MKWSDLCRGVCWLDSLAWDFLTLWLKVSGGCHTHFVVITPEWEQGSYETVNIKCFQPACTQTCQNISIHAHKDKHISTYKHTQRYTFICSCRDEGKSTAGQHTLQLALKKNFFCERCWLSSVSPPAGEVKPVMWAGQDPEGSGGEDQLPEGGQGTPSARYQPLNQSSGRLMSL